MTLYLDTLLLVSALANEAGTGRKQACLNDQEPDGLVISDWVTTEFSVALFSKLRDRQIEAVHPADSLAMSTRRNSDNFTSLPVSHARGQ